MLSPNPQPQMMCNVYTRIVLFVFVLLSSSVLYGQNGMSIKLGINGTRITNSTYEYNLRPGFAVGLAAYQEVIPNFLDFSIETGLSNENSSGLVEVAISRAKHQVNLDYWTSAFLMDFQITKELKAHLGLQYGYLILARSDFKRDDVLNGSNVTTYEFDQHNWSVLIGVEKAISRQLNLGVRYSHGLNNITPYSHNDVILFNTMPPESFLKHVRTCQVYVRRSLFAQSE